VHVSTQLIEQLAASVDEAATDGSWIEPSQVLPTPFAPADVAAALAMACKSGVHPIVLSILYFFLCAFFFFPPYLQMLLAKMITSRTSWIPIGIHDIHPPTSSAPAERARQGVQRRRPCGVAP
jgi:hypothetical protein